MVTLETLSYLSTAPDQFIDITEDVHAAIERSSVTNGGSDYFVAYDLWNRGKRGAALRGDGSYGNADRIAPLDAPMHMHTSCRAMEPPATTPVGISRA
ncbi:MAG: hypothetical protein ACLS89_05650 [Collinsella sp.]